MSTRSYLIQAIIGRPHPDDPEGFMPALAQLFPRGRCRFIDGRPDQTVAAGTFYVEIDDPSPALHAQLVADARVKYLAFEDADGNPLPDDTVIEAVPVAKRAELRAALEAANAPVHDFVGDRMNVRRFKQRLAKHFLFTQVLGRTRRLDLALDMTLGDVPLALRTAVRARLEAFGFDLSPFNLQTTIREFRRGLLEQSPPILRTFYD